MQVFQQTGLFLVHWLFLFAVLFVMFCITRFFIVGFSYTALVADIKNGVTSGSRREMVANFAVAAFFIALYIMF